MEKINGIWKPVYANIDLPIDLNNDPTGNDGMFREEGITHLCGKIFSCHL